MNKDNAKYFLPLVQALAEGKTIQFQHNWPKDEWSDCENLEFSDPLQYYRIKPEPREWWARIATEGNPTYPTGTLVGATTKMETGRPTKNDSWQYVRVREILD